MINMFGHVLPETKINMAMGASEVFKGKSGRFGVADDAGYVDAADATSVKLLCWVEGNDDFTCGASDGLTTRLVETDLYGKLFLMPACKDSAAAVTEAELRGAVGLTFDIQMVNTNYQYADLGASAVDILIGYGYVYEGSAAGQQYMIVKPNCAKVALTSHTDA
jgi:hypothetical protein